METEGKDQGCKVFLPLGGLTMDALLLEERLSYTKFYTPSAGGCFCLALPSGRTHCCDFTGLTFSHSMTLLFANPLDGNLDTLPATV